MGETEAEARAKDARGLESPRFLELTLAFQSAISGIDLSRFSLDAPLPEMSTNGSMAVLASFAQWGSGKPLRELVKDAGKGGAFEAVGTPDQVARRMAEVMEEVGGDGYLLKQPFDSISRRAILEVTEGLTPALQRLGVVRTRYATTTLRQTLLEF